MLNSIETYASMGKQAGKAARLKDYVQAREHSRWLSKALALESPEYRKTAQAAYDAAYKAENTGSPIYFN